MIFQIFPTSLVAFLHFLLQFPNWRKSCVRSGCCIQTTSLPASCNLRAYSTPTSRLETYKRCCYNTSANEMKKVDLQRIKTSGEDMLAADLSNSQHLASRGRIYPKEEHHEANNGRQMRRYHLPRGNIPGCFRHRL